MDRKTWLAVGLSILGIIGFQWWYESTYGPYLRQQEEARRQQAAVAAAANPAGSPTATPAPLIAPATPTPTPRTTEINARSETLAARGKKDSADFVFNNDTGGIEAVLLRMHLNEKQAAVVLNGDRRMPIGALATDVRNALGGFEMQADRSGGVVTFTKRDTDGLEIEKRFTLPQGDAPGAPYVASLELTFRNPTAAALSRPTLYLSTGAAAPIHHTDLPMYTRFDWSKDNRMNGIDIGHFNAGGMLGFEWRQASETFTETVSPVRWTAVTSQYFCTVVTALDVQGTAVAATRFPAQGVIQNGHPVFGIQGAMGLPPFTLEPGKALTQKFQIYAGPKELARLDQLGHGEDAVMNFGWFGFVSRFLLWAMNLLHQPLQSYAAAIIVLTILIKLALWPLQNKATNSMRKMAALSPKMTELREKYKDDPTKMNEELMKLYRDYGVNPFSGCLPMLIQIPIFFGFYSMLGCAIELRNSSFLWIHDLSQPDTVFHLLGFPVNILPLVMAGTMVWQIAISPKTGDATQQRIMMFMPIIFIVFAYNYASALSLYWTTQNLFSIVQLYLTRNTPLPTLEKLKAAAKKRPSESPGRSRKKRKP